MSEQAISPVTGAATGAATGSATGSVKTRAGKYLTFSLERTEYGLEILKVREIIGMMEITEVPRTPEFVRGVMNLRGKIIPVMELRQIFGMQTVEENENTRIVVVEIAGLELGIVVDGVREVFDIHEESIEDAPSFGLSVDTDFVLGIGKREERVTILLDIDKVLTGDQSVGLHEIAEPAQH
jgi:purine-binding chemotaxis protein CheW